ncbi:diacylglycerol/lipid kinase family protein [Sphingomonas sp.]|uniref:diacylglycerol/lipid kinase family protein n=1 Tax=Sphingomonas sp. TaxID=28214 RepID=UPI002DD67A21|nr:YegS/Rv2252/BmrU family lipid kinase [Sphingomonas sp.]
MTDFRSAALIVNAKSRKGQALFDQARTALASAPFTVDAHAVEDPEDLEVTVERALARKPDLVILGGGDGTVSGLVDLLVGKGVTLGVLPLGTANSFCRTLGIPLDVEGAVKVLSEGHPRRIDLGMIDGDYFANAATLGIAPQIAESVPHNLKKYLGRAGYLGWAALQYARFRPFWLTVDVGRGPQSLKVVEVRIANGRFHGGEEMMEEAEIDNGEIVVECVRGNFKRRLLANWAATVLRLEARRDDVVVFRGKSIKLDTRPRLPVSIDGEVLAKTPVTAKVAAGAIDVMVPAE